MGAGKTTLGFQVADRLGRRFVDCDTELERGLRRTIPQLFEERGEAGFRVLEAEATLDLLARSKPAVVALGGGAIETPAIRKELRRHAFTVLVEVEAHEAWERVRSSDRPLAGSRESFEALYERRRALYDDAAEARGTTVDDVVLAAGGVHVGLGALELLGGLVPGAGRAALVADRRVAGIHGADAQLALGPRLASTHELPPGEEAKALPVAERLWDELALERRDALVALGGGTTTDLAGFVAATYLRGIDWVPVPTTLVGQVDAAIGGKTALDLAAGKNLVGAFHWPARVVVDPALLETLPEAERRAGMAEVVKTGLLAGEELWELPEPELVRRCAAYKTAVCLRDPYDLGPRKALNLGHTFAHALEAAGGYDAVTHGRAVALGLLAALRLSGLDTQPVERILRPTPVRVDRDRAWAALRRDKKTADGRVRLVLLEAPGKPRLDAELPDSDVRGALDALIAG
jgi:3-dehydroquinate synthetase/shikimate kinase